MFFSIVWDLHTVFEGINELNQQKIFFKTN